MQTEAYIGLGSNMGDRELYLLRAVAEIGKLPGSKVTALSPFYETEPVGDLKQDNFYNAVLCLATTIPPFDLLHQLLTIESSIFNRTRERRWGPRRMDLDLLLYGEQIHNDDQLNLPHPRMHERRFVLVPLVDIAPDLSHPVLGKTMRELLQSLPAGERVTSLEGP